MEDWISTLQDQARQAYLQWIRHNPDRGGPFRIQVGETADLTCSEEAAGCHLSGGGVDVVILKDDWIERDYGYYQGDHRQFAIQSLFQTLTHEAGHQFDYRNPDGSDDGCGGLNGCHAPYYTGSVMSYDHTIGRSRRYYVTEDDISHIPGARWNGSPYGPYVIWRAGEPSSIESWGVWIYHEFRVAGMMDPSNTSGETLFIVENITGQGAIRGQPSVNALPDTSATYSGTDNFMGVHHHPSYRALLRADANLRYTFNASPTLSLRVNNFDAYYEDSDGIPGWHDYGWGDFRYVMSCRERGGCSGIGANARWYADDYGDPTGWVGGEVDDRRNEYAGSFVAEKE